MIAQKVSRFFLIFLNVFIVFTSGLSSREQAPTCFVPQVTQKWGPYLQQVTEPFDHGEEPTWDSRTQLLYFVDIHKGLVNSLNPATNEINSVEFPGTVSPIIPTNTLQRFVVGNNRSVILFTWNGKSGSPAENVTILTTIDNDHPENRFNDGKADKYGRLWWGTIGYENSSGVIPNEATLYKFTQKDLKKPDVEIRPVTNSNGLTWSKDNKKFYYIDTPTRKVAMYDFNLEKGEISNKKIAFDLANYSIGGIPDGMTIDENDHLFIALYNGGAIIKVDPENGTLLQKIAIPARDVTSCMFGGRNLDILFVTTSRHGLTETERESQPAAGSVFALTNLGTKGVETYLADF